MDGRGTHIPQSPGKRVTEVCRIHANTLNVAVVVCGGGGGMCSAGDGFYTCPIPGLPALPFIAAETLQTAAPVLRTLTCKLAVRRWGQSAQAVDQFVSVWLANRRTSEPSENRLPRIRNTGPIPIAAPRGGPRTLGRRDPRIWKDCGPGGSGKVLGHNEETRLLWSGFWKKPDTTTSLRQERGDRIVTPVASSPHRSRREPS